MSTQGYLADNLARVQERIAAACRRAGRRTEEVTLVAVSKTVSADAVLEAHRAGARHFGENRVEDALPKIAEVQAALGPAGEITWHLIGHLQRRKARDAMPVFQMVHSVDSVRLAAEMAGRLEPLGRVMPVLLEVNVSGEESKYGLSPAELSEAVEAILGLPSLALRGLMTMAPVAADPQEARPVFRGLRELRDELARRYPQAGWDVLSMGMTDDFEPAIEEGATLVRIGRAIFLPPA